MKKLALLFVSIIMVTMLSAQEKEIVEFSETTYDYGTIKEEDGKVPHTFTVTNVSSTAITIKHVRASCGCTVPSWSREPIAPNSNGEISVTYNAKGRPGSFHKSITVTLSNGTEDFTKMLYIKGTVTKKEVVEETVTTEETTK